MFAGESGPSQQEADGAPAGLSPGQRDGRQSGGLHQDGTRRPGRQGYARAVGRLLRLQPRVEPRADGSLRCVSCADPMDFSGMSLIKLKKEEMESQVMYGIESIVGLVFIMT